MSVTDFGWTRFAAELSGPRFGEFQTGLTGHNATRFQPSLPENAAPDELTREQAVARAEIAFVEAQRKAIAPLTADIPLDTAAFIAWFERLKETGPGQGDPLFPGSLRPRRSSR